MQKQRDYIIGRVLEKTLKFREYWPVWDRGSWKSTFPVTICCLQLYTLWLWHLFICSTWIYFYLSPFLSHKSELSCLLLQSPHLYSVWHGRGGQWMCSEWITENEFQPAGQAMGRQLRDLPGTWTWSNLF